MYWEEKKKVITTLQPVIAIWKEGKQCNGLNDQSQSNAIYFSLFLVFRNKNSNGNTPEEC